MSKVLSNPTFISRKDKVAAVAALKNVVESLESEVSQEIIQYETDLEALEQEIASLRQTEQYHGIDHYVNCILEKTKLENRIPGSNEIVREVCIALIELIDEDVDFGFLGLKEIMFGTVIENKNKKKRDLIFPYNPEGDPKIYNLKQAAKRLGIHKNELLRGLECGKFHGELTDHGYQFDRYQLRCNFLIICCIEDLFSHIAFGGRAPIIEYDLK